jgi:hypothetical protein
MRLELLPFPFRWILLAVFQCASSSSFLLVANRHNGCSELQSLNTLACRLPLIDALTRTETHLLFFHSLHVHDEGQKYEQNSRRNVLLLVPSVIAAAATIAPAPSRALAADGGKSQQNPPAATIWLSGKPPRIPGMKPKDKNDVSGTRKDPSFLRSIADCKNQCENVAGPDGLSKSKEECLSECQDICCTTYEQCTFAIVPRI